MSISPRRFRGWEPAEVTTYEYDEFGRLARSVTVRESEFNDSDRALLLADREEALAPRSSTGRLLSETTDPKNEGRYRVGLPVTDFAAKELARRQEQYAKQWGREAMVGTVWGVSLAPAGDDGDTGTST